MSSRYCMMSRRKEGLECEIVVRYMLPEPSKGAFTMRVHHRTTPTGNCTQEDAVREITYAHL